MRDTYAFDDNFDDFFNFFGFGKPFDLFYNTAGTKDMSPTNWVKTETGYFCVCRTVGVNPEDVSVEVENNYIKVSGESTYNNQTYNVSYKIPVATQTMSDIQEIGYESKNGLTFIYVTTRKPEIKQIEVKRLSNNG